MKNSKKMTKKRKKRLEDIDDYLLYSEHIQPDLEKKEPFYKALRKLLLKLPDLTFMYIKDEVWFVIENKPTLGFAFYNEKICYGLKLLTKKVRICTIVLFHDYSELSQQALIVLIVDNLAYYFSTHHKTVETFKKSKAEIIDEWGLSKEVDAFYKETNFRSN